MIIFTAISKIRNVKQLNKCVLMYTVVRYTYLLTWFLVDTLRSYHYSLGMILGLAWVWYLGWPGYDTWVGMLCILVQLDEWSSHKQKQRCQQEWLCTCCNYLVHDCCQIVWIWSCCTIFMTCECLKITWHCSKECLKSSWHCFKILFSYIELD